MGKGRYGSIGPDTVVYVSGAGWRDSDTSMGCIATTAKKAERDTMKQMREAAKRAREDEWDLPRSERRSLSDLLDDIAYYGVHGEKLSSAVSARELEGAIAALREDGIYYQEW